MSSISTLTKTLITIVLQCSTMSLTWIEVHILLFKHRLGFLTDKCHWKADDLINTNNYLPHHKIALCFNRSVLLCRNEYHNMFSEIQKEKSWLLFSGYAIIFFPGSIYHKNNYSITKLRLNLKILETEHFFQNFTSSQKTKPHLVSYHSHPEPHKNFLTPKIQILSTAGSLRTCNGKRSYSGAHILMYSDCL